jgi:hypothetical protein
MTAPSRDSLLLLVSRSQVVSVAATMTGACADGSVRQAKHSAPGGTRGTSLPVPSVVRLMASKRTCSFNGGRQSRGLSQDGEVWRRPSRRVVFQPTNVQRLLIPACPGRIRRSQAGRVAFFASRHPSDHEQFSRPRVDPEPNLFGTCASNSRLPRRPSWRCQQCIVMLTTALGKLERQEPVTSAPQLASEYPRGCRLA